MAKHETGNLKKPGRKLVGSDRRETEDHLGRRPKPLPRDLIEVGPDETSAELTPHLVDETDKMDPPATTSRRPVGGISPLKGRLPSSKRPVGSRN